MRKVYIVDCQIIVDHLSYNMARHCAKCFNLQSYHRDGRRRCAKHGQLKGHGFGETQAVIDGDFTHF